MFVIQLDIRRRERRERRNVRMLDRLMDSNSKNHIIDYNAGHSEYFTFK